MQVLDRVTIQLAALGLVFATHACTQKSFNLTEKSKSTSQAIALDPDTKANDRPTESGTGVPGYLVDCSPFNVEDDNVQVGCITTDSEGVRVMTSADAWKRFDIRLPPDSPYGVTINKVVATNLAAWDVNFIFAGADKTTLTSVARNSIYGYSYPNEAGQTVRIETAPLPPPVPVAAPTPAAGTGTTSCLGGAMVDGFCFVPVESSCTEYCGKAGLAPHPYVTSRFGAGNNVDEDANKRACHDLFAQIRGSQNFDFGDTLNARGMGCFEEQDGRVVYDKSDTNPTQFPRIGNKRICGCQ
ncbi:MAG TPA: hypothetical protein VFO10_11560 [Oligoflexus sp.]|uniref:hypothetical protein n=1 Tax=Oligoflexus sp. TaxID=1971216 RepID=UPI002D7FB595|nr:hypothetical protein [Oligoflexus sp.]HET9237883.1 hypothetical protein [Oligoflexus sp.]